MTRVIQPCRLEPCHRESKALEFDQMFIPGSIATDALPHISIADLTDLTEQFEQQTLLLHVAATRAKNGSGYFTGPGFAYLMCGNDYLLPAFAQGALTDQSGDLRARIGGNYPDVVPLKGPRCPCCHQLAALNPRRDQLFGRSNPPPAAPREH